MKLYRYNFRSALRECKLNEENEILISIQEKYKNKNMKVFVKEIKSKKGRKTNNDEII